MAKKDEAPESQVSPADSGSTSLVDLSTVNTDSRRLASPQVSVPWDGNVGVSTIKGAGEAKTAAEARKLPSPLAASLQLHQDEENPTVLYGLPDPAQIPGSLALEWFEQGRRFRTNMAAVLRYKKITIPKGTRMVIHLKHIVHPKLGPCLKLWWDSDCFVPIQYQDDDEE